MRRLTFWLFCLSLAMNIFFVGIYMADRQRGSTDGGTGPAGVMPYEALGLSAGQRAVFETERNRFHNQLRKTRQTIQSKQAELIHLLSMQAPDRAAVDSTQQEILNLQNTLQHDVITHLLEVAAPLNSEQRERFFALLKKRMTRHTSASAPECY
jgi:Spy/CpxP family protein refolding chaperone